MRKVRLGSDPLALYVHVPFCVTRCYFCDFVTVVGKSVTPELIDRYARALNTELDLYAEDSTFSAAPFETAQLGGGTPTMLSPHQLEDVLARAPARGVLPGTAETRSWLILAASEAMALEPPSAVADRLRTLLELTGYAADLA